MEFGSCHIYICICIEYGALNLNIVHIKYSVSTHVELLTAICLHSRFAVTTPPRHFLSSSPRDCRAATLAPSPLQIPNIRHHQSSSIVPFARNRHATRTYSRTSSRHSFSPPSPIPLDELLVPQTSYSIPTRESNIPSFTPVFYTSNSNYPMQ